MRTWVQLLSIIIAVMLVCAPTLAMAEPHIGPVHRALKVGLLRAGVPSWLAVGLFPAPSTYYVSYGIGSNSNGGTGIGDAWKAHPYMEGVAGCGGADPSYTHTAGDQFIFRGGDTWPQACLPVTLNAGGSSDAVRDVYTVDVTWFAGASYSAPVFDGEDTLITAGALSGFFDVNVNNVTINGFRMTRAYWDATYTGGTRFNRYQAISVGAANNITMSNLTFDDWAHAAIGGGQDDVYKFISGDTNPSVDHNQQILDVTCDGTDPGDSGTCIYYGVDYIDGLTCSSVRTCVIGKPISLVNSTVNKTVDSFDPGAHENGFELFGRTTTYANNTAIDCLGTAPCQHFAVTPNISILAYNNVIYASTVTNSGGLAIDTQAIAGNPSPNVTVRLINNTVMNNNSAPCIVFGRPSTTWTIETAEVSNTHCVTGNASTWTTLGTGTITPTENTNLRQTVAAAAADAGNYVPATAFRPQAAGGSTVDAGTDRTSVCAGCAQSIDGDTQGNPPNIGAYKWVPSGGGGTPDSSYNPTSLTFAFTLQEVQTTAVVGAISNVITATNVGDSNWTVSSVVAGGEAVLVSETCTSASPIAASGTCTITVAFKPIKAIPAARTGTITITSNAPTSPDVLNLSGTGKGVVPIGP